MHVIYQSRKFKEADIVSTYARLYSTPRVVKFFDVNKEGKTIREWWTAASDVPFSHKLIEGKTVLYGGLTMEERAHA
jgi:hypothetical protein